MSLALDQGQQIPPAYGILADISESGVQVLSDRILFQGQKLRLQIQFESVVEPFEADGRVAWTRPANEGGELGGTSLSGIELRLPSSESGQRLRDLLETPAFEDPWAEPLGDDDFFATLTPYLERVADLFVQLAPRVELR